MPNIYRFVARSGAEPDRNGLVTNPNGWFLDNFHLNPVVLINHQENSLPVATARAFVEGVRLMADVAFASTERAQEAEQLVKDGVLRGMSPGWRTPAAMWDYRRDDSGRVVGARFEQQELKELTLATIPADPRAVLQSEETLATASYFIGGQGFKLPDGTKRPEVLINGAAPVFAQASAIETPDGVNPTDHYAVLLWTLVDTFKE